MLFSCPKASLAPLSAVILHNETLYQKTDEVDAPWSCLYRIHSLSQEVPLLEVIAGLGIVPGVTLDKVGIAWYPGHMISWLPDLLITWSPEHLISWSHDLLITWSPDHLIFWSTDILINWYPDHLLSWTPDFLISWATDLPQKLNLS